MWFILRQYFQHKLYIKQYQFTRLNVVVVFFAGGGGGGGVIVQKKWIDVASVEFKFL